MKLHSFIREILTFSFILIFFLCPPIITSFTQEGQAILQWTIPVINLLYALFALVIYFEYKDKVEIKNGFFFLYKGVVPFTLCFGFLLTFSLIFKFISSLISNNISSNVIFPHDIITWGYCIFGFIFSAFFEEVIYRFYTPEILKYFFCKIKSKKVIFILSEFLSLMLFSLAHYYLGIFSVLNAVFGHIILRICYKESNSVIPGFLAHFLYNIISLILL